MKTWALILLCAWLGACATPPDRPADARFFAAVSETVYVPALR